MSKGVTFNENKGPVTIIDEGGSARPSILGKLIEIIATSDHVEVNLDRNPAEIDVKINFNDLTNHKWIIEEYIRSSLLIDESIEALNQTILNGSTKLKRQMKAFYNRALDKYMINRSPFDLDKLKLNSDSIVDEARPERRGQIPFPSVEFRHLFSPQCWRRHSSSSRFRLQ